MTNLLARFCGHEFRLEPSEHVVRWRQENGLEWRGEFNFPRPLSPDSKLIVARDELIITGALLNTDYIVTYVGEPLTFEFREEPTRATAFQN